MDKTQVQMSSHGGPPDSKWLVICGAVPCGLEDQSVEPRLGAVISGGVLFTMNSGVLLLKQEGGPLRPGPYCGGASDTEASDIVRRQDFRVGQAGYNPSLPFHACALEPVNLPGLLDLILGICYLQILGMHVRCWAGRASSV